MDGETTNKINKKREILRHVIEHGGNCAFLPSEEYCEDCPIAQWIQREDGSFLSCSAAVLERYGQNGWKDAFFAEAAKYLLGLLETEQMLQGSKDEV